MRQLLRHQEPLGYQVGNYAISQQVWVLALFKSDIIINLHAILFTERKKLWYLFIELCVHSFRME